MVRRWLEEVGNYPEYSAGVKHELLVKCVERLSGPNRIKVDLEHVDDAQLARPLTVVFPRPIPPAGRPIEFFRACGLEVASKFPPMDAIGKRVVCLFERDQDGKWCPIRFEPVVKEKPEHDATG